LELVGVGWRCGIKIFRRFDSINWLSRFFFSAD
jgi:pyruvate carboxylase